MSGIPEIQTSSLKNVPSVEIDCGILLDLCRKRCSKCEKVKDLEEFHAQKTGRLGKTARCKECVKKYYVEHKEEIKEYRNKYNVEHKEAKKAYNKKYRAEKKSYNKKYRAENKEEIKAYRKKLNHSPTTSSYYLDKLPPSDKPKMVDGFLTVICIKCGKRYAPTYQTIQNRAQSFKGTTTAAHNFYCSNECKNTCVLFNHHAKSIDPRSELHTENSNVRACQTNDLKQLQCDEFGYNYCEKCGDIIDVELHHTQPVATSPKEAINSAGHILLCAGCHVELHNKCK